MGEDEVRVKDSYWTSDLATVSKTVSSVVSLFWGALSKCQGARRGQDRGEMGLKLPRFQGQITDSSRTTQQGLDGRLRAASSTPALVQVGVGTN